MTETIHIPLFPLASIVMPGGLLPLRLFERRYIDMVKDCFKTNTGFGVCLIRDGRESNGPAEPYPMGTLVSIVDFDQGADGLLHITAQGDREFSIVNYSIEENQLLTGDIQLKPERVPTPMDLDFEPLAQKLDLILRYVEADINYDPKQLDDADWVCHRLMELLPLTGPAKFELLQMDSNRERLETLAALQIEIAER